MVAIPHRREFRADPSHADPASATVTTARPSRRATSHATAKAALHTRIPLPSNASHLHQAHDRATHPREVHAQVPRQEPRQAHVQPLPVQRHGAVAQQFGHLSEGAPLAVRSATII